MSAEAAQSAARASRVLYVAGYGRSGSTLLESILSCEPGIVGVGELSYLEEGSEIACACGALLADCEFWSQVLAKGRERGHVYDRTMRDVRWFTEGVGPRCSKRPSSTAAIDRDRDFRRATLDLFDLIAGVAGPGTRYIIDSSKTAYTAARRPLLLDGLLGDRLRVLHLVRDPRGVLSSMVHKGTYINEGASREARKSRLAALRAVVGWRTANRWAEKLDRPEREGRYLMLRYEDLTQKPLETAARLEDFLEVDLPALRSLADGELQTGVTHQLMGNPLRFGDTIRLRPDDTWKTRLARRHLALARFLLRGRMARYGYG